MRLWGPLGVSQGHTNFFGAPDFFKTPISFGHSVKEWGEKENAVIFF